MVLGRPSKFNDAVAQEICERLIGGESLRAICKDEHMPAATNVFMWLASADTKFKTFHEQYARAREAQADAIVDEILEISDDAKNDWMDNNDPENPGYKLNGEHVQRSRLRVDSRKWFAGKLYPKRYGDKQHVEHSGDINLGLADRLEKARKRAD